MRYADAITNLKTNVNRTANGTAVAREAKLSYSATARRSLGTAKMKCKKNQKKKNIGKSMFVAIILLFSIFKSKELNFSLWRDRHFLAKSHGV